MEGRPIILTGMPRSGITVVAQAFYEAGLFLGHHLGGVEGSTPYGLQDRDVQAFHQGLLPRGLDTLALPPDAKFEPPSGSESDAKALLESKFKDRTLFGWKDPRTLAFLDFWDGLLPDARWVLVWRDPAPLAWSIVNRGTLHRQTLVRQRQAVIALRHWVANAERVLSFARQNPDRCVLVSVTGGLHEGGERALDHVVRESWRCDLDPVRLCSEYRPHLLRQSAPLWVRSLARAFPSVRGAQRELRALEADLYERHGAPPVGEPPPEPKRPVVVVVGRQRGEYSQTFIHDHVTFMPAETHFLYDPGTRLRTSDGVALQSVFQRAAGAWLREFGMRTPWLDEHALARWLKKNRVEAVIAEFGPTGMDIAEGCFRAGVPLTVHFHGYDVHSSHWRRKFKREYRDVLPRARAVVAVSRGMADAVVEVGAPREKVFWNPCGVDVSRFHGGDPAKAPPSFLAAGRFVDKKGPVFTVQAFAKVVEEFPEAHLEMIGEGPLLDIARLIARQLGVYNRISFPGAKAHAEVRRRMRKVRAFLQHSIETHDGNAEGTPVAVLEASATGVPVIATAHAGIREAVIDGETGLLVEEQDVEAMANAMLRLARDPELAAELGRRGREHMIENYAMEKRAGRLLDIALGKAPPEG